MRKSNHVNGLFTHLSSCDDMRGYSASMIRTCNVNDTKDLQKLRNMYIIKNCIGSPNFLDQNKNTLSYIFLELFDIVLFML